MLLHHIKIAFRFILRNLSFSLINLIGLSTGIAAFLLIALYLQDQTGYDAHIPYPDKTFRLVGIQEPKGLDKQHVSITSGSWAPFINENIPQAEEAFRVMNARGVIVETEEDVFEETNAYYSEGNAMFYLGYDILQGGDPEQMLQQPNQAVISKTTANRLYGNTDVIGKTFRMADASYTIAGIFDNENLKTHLQINIFLSFSTVEPTDPWLLHFGNNTLTTYIVKREDATPEDIVRAINQKQESLAEDEQYGPQMMKNTFYMQNVKDIYLRSGHIKFSMRTHEGNINSIYIFSVIAILILALACINFINLATANSAKRVKEVGLRKVLGASRAKLSYQFLGESFIITLLAVFLSLVWVEVLLPWYNQILGTELKIDFLNNYLFNLGLIVLLMVLALVSGFYPAMYLSRFQAASILRSEDQSGKPQKAALRKILVIVQFAISTAMIFATFVVMHQVHHMNHKNLGYNVENVVSVFHRQSRDYEQLKSFRHRILQLPFVVDAGIASGHHGVAGRQSTIRTADSIPTELMVRYGYVDPDFFTTMEMQFLEGRNFSHEFGTDPENTIILNRAAKIALGWEEAIGKRMLNEDNEDVDFYTVIGVIDDYHYYSLRTPIEPAVYIWRPTDMGVTNIRFSHSNPSEVMKIIESEFNEYFPGQMFHARFLDEILQGQYRQETNSLKIFMAFALLCIVISCLGLFGLTSFMVNQRRKEISVRKVLGAGLWQLNQLLMISFLRWVLVASLVALPLAWYFMNNWLDNYAYQIQIGGIHFTISLLLVSIIAIITIAGLTTRAALQNPAIAIKYE